MCDITNEFILCTCDADLSQVEYSWCLKRSNLVDVIIGELFINYTPWEEKTVPERIEYYLNNTVQLFDKEIELQEDDTLEINYKGKPLYVFTYSMDSWSIVTDLEDLEPQLIYKKGKVDISPNPIKKSNNDVF